MLNLGLTKGGQRRGVEESVIVDDPKVIALCLKALLFLLAGDKLVDVSDYLFRKQFAEDIASLGLSDEYKPYSFRRGGATHFYRTCGNLGALTTRGRWSDQKTARIYVDEAVAEIALVKFNPKQLRNIRRARMVFEAHIVSM